MPGSGATSPPVPNPWDQPGFAGPGLVAQERPQQQCPEGWYNVAGMGCVNPLGMGAPGAGVQVPAPRAPAQPPAAPAPAPGQQIGCPSGFHPNKQGYFTQSEGWIPKGTKCVKNRRRNALNPKAAKRSLSRIRSLKKAMDQFKGIRIPEKC